MNIKNVTVYIKRDNQAVKFIEDYSDLEGCVVSVVTEMENGAMASSNVSLNYLLSPLVAVNGALALARSIANSESAPVVDYTEGFVRGYTRYLVRKDAQLLHEQIAYFALNFPVPDDYQEGQAEWIREITMEAEEFCIHHYGVDWDSHDWYITSDQWMNAYIEGKQTERLIPVKHKKTPDPERKPLSYYMDLETEGSEGELNRMSTDFEFELCQGALMDCRKIINSLINNEPLCIDGVALSIDEVKRFIS